MLPIIYGDEVGLLAETKRVKVGNGAGWRTDPRKAVGIQLVKTDRTWSPTWATADCHPCGECRAHRAVAYGRVYCPNLDKAINSDRCRRIRHKADADAVSYMKAAILALAEERQHQRQEKQERREEAMRVKVEARAEALAGAKPPKVTSGGGKRDRLPGRSRATSGEAQKTVNVGPRGQSQLSPAGDSEAGLDRLGSQSPEQTGAS